MYFIAIFTTYLKSLKTLYSAMIKNWNASFLQWQKLKTFLCYRQKVPEYDSSVSSQRCIYKGKMYSFSDIKIPLATIPKIFLIKRTLEGFTQEYIETVWENRTNKLHTSHNEFLCAQKCNR